VTNVPAGGSDLETTTSQWWAEEASVFAAYWDSPGRTLASDLGWLRRQCYKELYDGVVPRVCELQQARGLSLTNLTREIREEAAHYDIFAAVYERFLVRDANWPENAALGALRARHRRDHGVVGTLAGAVTEGGGCSLFRSGIERAGHGGIDDAIAAACRRVYADERDHVGAAFSAVDAAQLAPADATLLIELVDEQCAARIAMRETQFRPR
jgi:hypothetical protein